MSNSDVSYEDEREFDCPNFSGVIASQKWTEKLKDKARKFIAAVYGNDGAILSVDSITALAELVSDARQEGVESDEKCDGCERISTDEAYAYVCDNPPERY